MGTYTGCLHGLPWSASPHYPSIGIASPDSQLNKATPVTWPQALEGFNKTVSQWTQHLALIWEFYHHFPVNN